MTDPIIIIGGGAAGFAAAQAARNANPDCEVHIFCDEDIFSPYARPMLTKLPLSEYHPEEHCYGHRGFDRSILWHADRSVERIIPASNLVFSRNQAFFYSRLIFACGASSFVPPIPGVDRKGVFTLRTERDLHRIARHALRCRDAVIIGGGVIGLEAAYQLSDFGLKVTVLETATHLMPRLLDRDASELLQSKITRFAVKTGVNVTNITDSSVCIAGGEPIPAELVILCCGNRANAELAKACGIAVDRGILVDDRMQTSVPNVFACGDCTQWQGSNTGLWPQALEQGRVAGINAAGGHAEYHGSDTRLLMNGPEFALYAEGDLHHADEIRSTTTVEHPSLEINPRFHTGICREYYQNGRLTGAFLLGDLTPMAELHRRLTEDRA